MARLNEHKNFGHIWYLEECEEKLVIGKLYEIDRYVNPVAVE